MFVRLKLRVKLLFKTVTHLLAQASFGSEMWWSEAEVGF